MAHNSLLVKKETLAIAILCEPVYEATMSLLYISEGWKLIINVKWRNMEHTMLELQSCDIHKIKPAET